MRIPPHERDAKQDRRRRAVDAARRQCGGPADVAPKPGQPTKTQDQPPWRKTRFA